MSVSSSHGPTSNRTHDLTSNRTDNFPFPSFAVFFCRPRSHPRKDPLQQRPEHLGLATGASRRGDREDSSCARAGELASGNLLAKASGEEPRTTPPYRSGEDARRQEPLGGRQKAAVSSGNRGSDVEELQGREEVVSTGSGGDEAQCRSREAEAAGSRGAGSGRR